MQSHVLFTNMISVVNFDNLRYSFLRQYIYEGSSKFDYNRINHHVYVIDDFFAETFPGDSQSNEEQVSHQICFN